MRGIGGVGQGSCDAIYCSHILEHLALDDLRLALRNTHGYLRPGGIFRVVVPDFEQQMAAYQSNPNPEALSNFMGYTHLGRHRCPKGIKDFLREHFRNSPHLWMWDEKGLAAELKSAGFTNIRRCQAGDSVNKAFLAVENPDRFAGGLAFECSR
ncbi:MAG: methyltransferase domain-containing protein [Verrucomicrobiales bacterium]